MSIHIWYLINEREKPHQLQSVEKLKNKVPT